MKKLLLIIAASIIASSITAQPCTMGKAKNKLDINNVNTTILNSGDLWWDTQRAKYEVPKGSGNNALFNGALWIGGIDQGGEIRLAAMTYRQNGIDFWPGPLDTTTATTNSSVCNQYDRIWKVERHIVDSFRVHYKDPGYVIPKDILEWPGNGNTTIGQSKNLAPYIDVNTDGFYNALDGDYPAYNFTGTPSCNGNYLLGDQTLWWIFNDKGNNHTESKCNGALGIEIQAQAYAYKSINDLGNTTFYQYHITNRSSNTYSKMYVGQFTDVDMGYPFDDYVGCDVKRGMGIGYNGSPIDGSGYAGAYGNHPPAIGIDFLGGPLADANDGKDNDNDGTTDEPGERINMSKFVYFNNDFTTQGNPTKCNNYYNYLQGRWLDSTQITYGGNGKGGTIACDYMFPLDSDPTGIGTNGLPQAPWSESTSGNPLGDRRFLMSAGAFTMKPGDVQIITIGVIWAQDLNGNNLDAIKKLQKADDLIQTFYDSCYKSTYICDVPGASMNLNTNQLSVNCSCPVTGPTYKWDFGDGSTSTLQNPTHTYAAPGQYTVNLKITHNCSSDSISQKITVYKSAKPLGVKLQRMEGQGNGGWIVDMLKESEDSIFTNPSGRVLHPIYQALHGPVRIDVLDSTLVPKGVFALQFNDTTPNANWKLFKYNNSGLSSDTVYSSSAISIGNYQLIPGWGLAVQAKYSNNPGTTDSEHNGFLEASMEFTDPAKNWLTGLHDRDTTDNDNWIRSGQMTSSPFSPFDDYFNMGLPIDAFQHYEKVIGGTWAPYRLCAFSDAQQNCTAGPAWVKQIVNNKIQKTLSGVDVVITSDTSKWTRCPVLELQEQTALSEGNARKLDLRNSASVNKKGVKGDGVTASTNPSDPGYISATGMGWFPGYAINVETGERLNMAFGEDSGLPGENGQDMIWNPTANIWSNPVHKPLFGGKHYIYIFSHTSDLIASPVGFPGLPGSIPRYDGGLAIWKLLNTIKMTSSNDNAKKIVYNDAMWVNIPLLSTGHQLLESDARIRIRVSQKYAYGFSARNGTTASSTSVVDTLTNPFNKNFPLYNFSSANISTSIVKNNINDFNVNVFPNPANNEATFVLEGSSGTWQLGIYDINGKKIINYDRINEKQYNISCENMSAGIYFYLINNAEGKSKVGKLIVK